MSDFPEPKVEVWDDNWDVLDLFLQYKTQWRCGPNGAIGLDYNVFHHALDRKRVEGTKYDDWLADLSIIESQALAILSKPA